MKVLSRPERNNIFSSIYSLLTAKKGNDDQLIIQCSLIAQTRDDGKSKGTTFEGTQSRNEIIYAAPYNFYLQLRRETMTS